MHGDDGTDVSFKPKCPVLPSPACTPPHTHLWQPTIITTTSEPFWRKQPSGFKFEEGRGQISSLRDTGAAQEQLETHVWGRTSCSLSHNPFLSTHEVSHRAITHKWGLFLLSLLKLGSNFCSTDGPMITRRPRLCLSNQLQHSCAQTRAHSLSLLTQKCV